MPARRAALTASDVARYVRERCFAPAGSPAGGLVGVEVEWLVHPAGDPRRHVALGDLQAAVEAAGPLPGGDRITYEPGGQLELSSPPEPGPGTACARAAEDLAVLDRALHRRGIALVGIGMDPIRRPVRLLDSPRYAAMEAFFDEAGRAGRTMMCSTASVQVNVDFGPDPGATWRLAHAAGAVMAAAFANSPLLSGAPSGWRSSRLANWWAVDPSRTRACAGEVPEEAFTDYVQSARVMLIRHAPDRFEPVLAPLPFGRWVREGHCGTWPTLDDLEYHLTTLFPPVRPRGFLELRMVDALPDPWWRVPVALAASLLGGDPDTSAATAAAVAPVAGWWRHAARHALADPDLQRAADTCFGIAADVLESGPDADLAALVRAYRERYVARGRCPADDRLGAWSRFGAHHRLGGRSRAAGLEVAAT